MAELTQDQVREIIAKAPKGTSPEGIVAALRETHTLEGYKAPAAVPGATSPGQKWWDKSVTDLMRGYAPTDPERPTFPGTLPVVGGLVGGLVGTAGGPVGRAVGSGIGGALGEAGREVATGEPVQGLHIAQQGVQQAGLGVLGEVGGEIVKGVGGALMQKSLGIVSSLADRFKTTPEAIAQIVLRERLPVTQAGQETAQALGNAVKTARNATLRATPGTLTARDLSTTAIKDAQTAIGRPLTVAERRVIISQVQDEADAILTQRTHGAVPHGETPTPGIPAQPASTIVDEFGKPAIPAKPEIPPGPTPPSRYTAMETEQIKEVAARNANPAYRAKQALTSVSADPALSEQIAQGARSRLETIPGVAEQNARLSDLKSARLAIKRALSKSDAEWSPVKLGPFSAVGVKVPRHTMADVALFLTHPDFQRLLRQSPRAGAALYQQLIETADPGEEGQ